MSPKAQLQWVWERMAGRIWGRKYRQLPLEFFLRGKQKKLVLQVP